MITKVVWEMVGDNVDMTVYLDGGPEPYSVREFLRGSLMRERIDLVAEAITDLILNIYQ